MILILFLVLFFVVGVFVFDELIFEIMYRVFDVNCILDIFMFIKLMLISLMI